METTLTHVVALSGGKDSTAMALRLGEVEPLDYTYVCTPTGHEPPELFEHWNRLGQLLGKPIKMLEGPTLGELILKFGSLPNWRQRWCTRVLKIERFATFLNSIPKPITSHIGLRADEGIRESGDYSNLDGVLTDFPMRRWRWTLHDVRSYLSKRGIEIPKRTDCLECFFQRLDEWYVFWRDYPEEWKRAEEYETMTGHTFRSSARDSWPAAMTDLRTRFESGDIPKKARDGALQNLKCRVCRL